ncbi:DUF4271 domain-containing protein [Paraflavitalea pollutisoli]|uniref:DUF4271 domain-containing protein n=1 Tax=Paraflavitalea pollutisoli TaxID=3034143 RepID=UPI0023EC05DB|nr:DUF4271 domain-containing protein [Paraflavitalea sp. H1-2-19X]
MKKIVLLVVGCILCSVLSFAQDQDTTARPPQVTAPVPAIRDTGVRKAPVVRKKNDSLVRVAQALAAARRDSLQRDSLALVAARQRDSAMTAQMQGAAPHPVENTLAGFQATVRNHPYYNTKPGNRVLLLKDSGPFNTDGIFYFLLGLVFYFAIVRLFYHKYLHDIMTLFFRASMRQQQLREQLSQMPLPSLFLNILFFCAGGMFLAFVALHYQLVPEPNLWLLWGYCCGLVLAVYLGKFIILKVVGWIFNVSNATDTYIFVIFMVNKMIGILLLPVLFMIAFPYQQFLPVILTLAFITLGLALVYRFIIAYKPIRNEIKVSRFHFFIYLCAFEIAPLLLIYKVLLNFVERSY